ncbi:MAG: polyprenol phosphomannose-dependent alpha 1,6 mannosyltransferase MptB [Arthrobacter sp.]|jgi:hypothetical protein|nr:polyprenol phosphomannose-dependent alpha 1,6 mannosyltransferase MptB [Arthrobacter sp.]
MNEAVATTAPNAVSHRGVFGVVAQGFLGAVLVALGSLGVGWLAVGSPLNRWRWLVPWRVEAPGVFVTVVVLTIGVWVMFAAWLRLGRLLRPWGNSLKQLWIACAVWSVPLMLAVPIFSRDVYAYIGQGRIVLGGGDPYLESISSVPNWLQLGADVNWAESQTAYGPLFYWLAAGVVSVTGLAVEPAIFLFRVLAWIGIALTMVYVPKLAALHQVNGVKAAWITVANPFFLLSFVASAHNDALMVGLSVAAVYYAAKRRGVLAIVLLVASVGIKPITLVLLPFVGLLWAGPRASWPRRITYWVLSAVLAIALCALMGLPGGFGFGWVGATLSAGGGYLVWFAPLGIFAGALIGLMGGFGLDSGWVLPAVQLLGRVAALGIILVLLFKGAHSRLVQRMLLAFTALVVLSPVVQPWYLLWLLPFFAATGIRDDWQLLWVYATVAFFIAFGCFDQVFLWQFNMQWKPLVQLVSIATSLVCLAALLLLSRPLRREIAELIPRARWVRWWSRA